MPKKNKIAAVIDIGSNDLKLRIAQANKENKDTQQARKMDYLETLSHPLGLGRDTFQTGSMSFDKADKACEIIKNFLQVAEEYEVKLIKTVATTAVREAANMDYILDQIKIKTGLTVQVLDDMEEKRYIFKLLAHIAGEGLTQSAMMVYTGAGNIGVSILTEGRMPFIKHVRVGALRLSEMFDDESDDTGEFYRLMEEYLDSFTNQMALEIPNDIQHFIVSGHEAGSIAKLTQQSGAENLPEFADNPMNTIPRETFLNLYDDIRSKDAEKIAERYGIDDDKADLLLPTACIYQNLLRLTQAKDIIVSPLLPCDAALYEMLYPKRFNVFDKQFSQNTLLSAEALAVRFRAQEAHYRLVYDFSLTIFDRMKKNHGLAARDKLLLQTAAILHDVGKYINTHNHYTHSYDIVRGLDIVGLNQLETEMVALLSLYHSRLTPSLRDIRYAELDVNTRMRVSKLTAIIRVADALDRSHTQKFSQIAVKITEEAMIVTVATEMNVALEQWSFNEKGRFFEEVFGIKAILNIKRNG